MTVDPRKGEETISYKEAKAHIKELIGKLRLIDIQARILELIAIEYYGFPLSAAPSILGASLNLSAEECSHALLALTGATFILTVESESHSRVEANYIRIGVSEEIRQALSHGPPAFEQLDAPHSHIAMATLHSMFLNEEGAIYIGLEITSHRVFEKLTQRASNGFLTVFLMPHRSIISPEKQTQYDDVLEGWVRYIRELPMQSRHCIRLRLTKIPYRYLYTGSLTSHFVRFDCYWYDQQTTRRGIIVKANNGSSLYDLLHREYSHAFEHSVPLFRLWPWEWLKSVGFKFAPLTITAVLLMAAFLLEETELSKFDLAKYVAVFLIGLAGESAWELYRSHVRTPRGLYKN